MEWKVVKCDEMKENLSFRERELLDEGSTVVAGGVENVWDEGNRKAGVDDELLFANLHGGVGVYDTI
jgi:hypothetical protein